MQRPAVADLQCGMWRHVSLIACLVACASDPAISEVESSVTCPPEWCAGNSPEIAHLGFWELNLDHQVNDQGFALLGMSKVDPSSGRAQFFDLAVQNSALAAIDPQRHTSITGDSLDGFTLWLSQGSSQYGLIISQVHSVPEAVPHGGRVDLLATYLLLWNTVTGRPLPGPIAAGTVLEAPILDPKNPAMPTCPDEVPWTTDGSWDESAPMARFNAVVFEGDRFDANARTVKIPVADDRWFNIGCARHTLAKMRLTRNTLHTVVSGDWKDVQATLKMLSADYCGTGQAFTVTGTPLLWQGTSPGMMAYWQPPQPGTLEARWDELGATCLGTPRLTVHPSPLFPVSKYVPTLAAYLMAACTKRSPSGLPLCASQDPLVSAGERITSANWNPPPAP